MSRKSEQLKRAMTLVATSEDEEATKVAVARALGFRNKRNPPSISGPVWVRKVGSVEECRFDDDIDFVHSIDKQNAELRPNWHVQVSCRCTTKGVAYNANIIEIDANSCVILHGSTGHLNIFEESRARLYALLRTLYEERVK